MTKEEIKKAIINGEIIITTKELIKEAVRENISGLRDYDDFHDFSKGTHSIDDEEIEKRAEWIIEYLTEE